MIFADVCSLFIFFFKQKTAYEMRISDWSSDVCSSDLRSVIADNVLDRQFTADRPNQKWVADFTYIWTAEGWLYVAAVIDLFSRRVVGWSMSPNMTDQLVTDALIMAILRRGKPDAILHHSGQGSSTEERRVGKGWGSTCRCR